MVILFVKRTTLISQEDLGRTFENIKQHDSSEGYSCF